MTRAKWQDTALAVFAAGVALLAVNMIAQRFIGGSVPQQNVNVSVPVPVASAIDFP